MAPLPAVVGSVKYGFNENDYNLEMQDDGTYKITPKGGEIEQKNNISSNLGLTNLNNFEFHTKKMEDFIQNDYQGEMNWLKDKLDIRKNPKNIWKDAKSAIVLGMNYGPEKDPTNGSFGTGEANWPTQCMEREPRVSGS